MSHPLTGPKAAQTRRHLLTTASQLYARASASEVKIEAIAAHAGVSVGTVYVHFGSKAGLALAYEEQLLDDLIAQLQAARNDRSSPLERVIAAGEAYLEYIIEHPVAARLASARASYPDADRATQDPQSKELDRKITAALLDVAADLKAAMECGEIMPEPIDELMIFLWGAWSGVAMMVARNDQLAIPPATARRAVALGRRLLIAGAQDSQHG